MWLSPFLLYCFFFFLLTFSSFLSVVNSPVSGHPSRILWALNPSCTTNASHKHPLLAVSPITRLSPAQLIVVQDGKRNWWASEGLKFFSYLLPSPFANVPFPVVFVMCNSSLSCSKIWLNIALGSIRIEIAIIKVGYSLNINCIVWVKQQQENLKPEYLS